MVRVTLVEPYSAQAKAWRVLVSLGRATVN